MRRAIAGAIILCLGGLLLVAIWPDQIRPMAQGMIATEVEGDSTEGRALELSTIEARTAGTPGRNERVEIEKRQGPFSTARIQVVHKEGGLITPLAGALVYADPRFSAERPVGAAPPADDQGFATDADGLVILHVNPSTQGEFTVTWPSSEWAQQRIWRTPAPGKTGRLQILLELGREDIGVVIRSFPGGQPIENAEVLVGSPNTLTKRLGAGSGVSDHRGRVRVPHPLHVTRNPYRITVKAERHAKRTFVVEPSDKNDEPESLWLRRNATLTGAITLASQGGTERAPRVVLVPSSASPTVGGVLANLNQTQSRGELPGERRADRRQVFTRPSQDRDLYPGGEIAARVQAGVDGGWAMMGIEFKDDAALEDHVLAIESMNATRVLASDISLGPGDVLRIDDPWLECPAVDLQFRLDDGRPASDLGRVELWQADAQRGVVVAKAPPVAVKVAGDGRLRYSHLPKGAWRWQLTGPANTVTAEGAFEHKDATTQEIRLTGYSSISGSASFPTPTLGSVRWRVVGADPSSAKDVHTGEVIPTPDGRFRIPLVPVGVELELTLVSRSASATSRTHGYEFPQALRMTVGAWEHSGVVLSPGPTVSPSDH